MAVFRGIELYVRAYQQPICYSKDLLCLLIIDSFIKKFTYIQCKYYTIRTFVLERITLRRFLFCICGFIINSMILSDVAIGIDVYDMYS